MGRFGLVKMMMRVKTVRLRMIKKELAKRVLLRLVLNLQII
ncbi:hypothetical protein NC651_011651 [Populus alba x Populus x berolinensis]|nr:hypothetical protein NC651_011651 [Populus alba x Populus x berolinensis]